MPAYVIVVGASLDVWRVHCRECGIISVGGDMGDATVYWHENWLVGLVVLVGFREGKREVSG